MVAHFLPYMQLLALGFFFLPFPSIHLVVKRILTAEVLETDKVLTLVSQK